MSKENFTRSTFELEDVEVRKNDDSGAVTVSGYAAVFEKLSAPMFGFREKIRAGAFTKSISKNRVKALWNHNSDKVLGSTKAGTLRLEEDKKGLRFELDLPDTTSGRDAEISIRRKDVDGMSFGFRTITQEWDESDAKNIVRTLIDLDLREVSATPFPAYPQTNVKARSIEDDYQEHVKESNDDKDVQERQNRENELQTKMQLIKAL